MRFSKNVLLSLAYWLVTVGVSILALANAVANEEMITLTGILIVIAGLFGYTAYAIQKGKTYGYMLGIVVTIILVLGYIILTFASSSVLEQCGTEYDDLGCRLGAISLKIIASFLFLPIIITGLTAPFLLVVLWKNRHP